MSGLSQKLEYLEKTLKRTTNTPDFVVYSGLINGQMYEFHLRYVHQMPNEKIGQKGWLLSFFKITKNAGGQRIKITRVLNENKYQHRIYSVAGGLLFHFMHERDVKVYMWDIEDNRGDQRFWEKLMFKYGKYKMTQTYNIHTGGLRYIFSKS